MCAAPNEINIFGYTVDPNSFVPLEGLSKESKELTAFCALGPAIDALVNNLASGFLAVAGLTGCLTTAILGGPSLRKNVRRFLRQAEQAAEMMRGTISQIAEQISDKSKDGGLKSMVAFADNKSLDKYVEAKIERDRDSALAAAGVNDNQDAATEPKKDPQSVMRT